MTDSKGRALAVSYQVRPTCVMSWWREGTLTVEVVWWSSSHGL